MKCRVEWAGGTGRFPEGIRDGAETNLGEEGGSRGKPGFPRGTEPQAEDEA
jgi:hypothetical protein